MIRKIAISNVKKELSEEEYDVFICSSSFEDRCLSVATKVKSCPFKRIIVVTNKIGCEEVQNNKEKLLAFFGNNAIDLAVDFGQPLLFAEMLSQVLSTGLGRSGLRILVDVTTFNHEFLVVGMNLLATKRNVVQISCIYSSASEYCPGKDLNEKWLSKGCKEIRPIVGYSGMLFPSRRLRLVLIVGYECERALEVINQLEPNEITLVYGEAEKSTTEKNKEAGQLYSEAIKDLAYGYDSKSISLMSIPCNDPDVAAVLLREEYAKYTEENVVVIPMNNKLTTLALMKSLEGNDDVQVCYAPAIIYNEANYSAPGKTCYIYQYKGNKT